MTVTWNRHRSRWCYDFTRKGARFQGYCMSPAEPERHASTETEAEEWETCKRAEAIKDEQKPRPKVTAYAFGMAVAKWVPIAQRLKSWDTVEDYLAELLEFFGPEAAVVEVDHGRAQEYVTWALQQRVRVYIGGPRDRAEARRRDGLPLFKDLDRLRTPDTVNKYLSALSQVLELAHLARDPATGKRRLEDVPRLPFQKVARRTRRRSIPPQTLAQLIAEAPDHLAETVIGIQLTQLRMREMLRLPGSALDEYERGLWPGTLNKASREDFIPLGPAGFAFFLRLKRRAEQVGIDRMVLYLDTTAKGVRDGVGAQWRTVDNVSRSFRTRLRALGLEGRHTFHHTKSTGLNAMKRLGAHPTVLRELGHHADFQTTQQHYLDDEVEDRRAALTLYEAQLTGLGVLPPAPPAAAEGGRASEPGTAGEPIGAAPVTYGSHLRPAAAAGPSPVSLESRRRSRG